MQAATPNPTSIDKTPWLIALRFYFFVYGCLAIFSILLGDSQYLLGALIVSLIGIISLKHYRVFATVGALIAFLALAVIRLS